MMDTSTVSRADVMANLSSAERDYLVRGLEQPGGKLPLFDARGQLINPQIIHACIRKGYASRWFANPIKPDWLVCRLTDIGRDVVVHAKRK